MELNSNMNERFGYPFALYKHSLDPITVSVEAVTFLGLITYLPGLVGIDRSIS